MQCFYHDDVSATYTCAGECGKGLCDFCAEQYDPPTCPQCLAQQIKTVTSVFQEEANVIRRQIRNQAWLLLLVLSGPAVGLYSASRNGDLIWLTILALLLYIPGIVWGLWAMGQLLGTIDLGCWFGEGGGCLMIFLGLLFMCAAPIVIPITMLKLWMRLQEVERGNLV